MRRLAEDPFFGKLNADLERAPQANKPLRKAESRREDRAKTELEKVNPELGLLMHRLRYTCERLRDFYLSSASLTRDAIPELAGRWMSEELTASIEPAKDALMARLLKNVSGKELRRREGAAARRQTQIGYGKAPGAHEQTELELLDAEIGSFITHVEFQLGTIKNYLDSLGTNGIEAARDTVMYLADEIAAKEAEFVEKYTKE